MIYLLGKDRGILSASSLKERIPDIGRRDVFMCGPPGLTSAVRDALQALGLPPRQVHEEQFSF